MCSLLRSRPRRAGSLVLLLVLLLTASMLCAAAAQGAPVRPERQQLTVNIGTFPSTLDPSKVATEADRIVQNALFAPLYRSPGGPNGKLVPFLAAGAPKVSNGGRTWTVQLRAARWSDGSPVTAADVVFAWSRARSSLVGGLFTPVTSVSAMGPRTVRIQLRRAVPWFEELLASNALTPMPAKVVRRHGTKWTQTRNLVTSGPFKLDRPRGRSELRLLPNPHWWGASRMQLRELDLVASRPASASGLFDAKRIDATMRSTSVLPAQAERRRTDARMRTVASSAAHYLWLNTRAPELAQPAVRRGIALALDRAALAQTAGGGLDRPLRTVVPSGIRGHHLATTPAVSLLDESGAADITRARQELTAGGWDPRSRFDLYFLDERPSGELALQIASQLDAVGVDVALHPTSARDFAKVGVGVAPLKAEVDAVLQGASAVYSDPQDFHRRFTCDAVETGWNLSGLCDPAYDAVYDGATTSALPFATRMSAHRQLEELLTGPSGLMPAVPLFDPAGEYLVQPWVRGFVHHPSGLVDFERVVIHDS